MEVLMYHLIIYLQRFKIITVKKSKLKKENTKKGNIMAEKSCETKIQENRMMQHIHCRKSL